MNTSTLIMIMLCSAIVPAVAIAAIGYAGVRALGRNPSAAPQILISILVAFLYTEAIVVLMIWVVFYLLGR